MLRKAGFALLFVLPLAIALQSADLHELYNQMYPVNSLKRDAFDLCHESDATFVRAFDADRESCYGRMPHNFALAIGYVRPGTELAALEPNGRGWSAADLLVAQALAAAPPAQRRLLTPMLAALTEPKTGALGQAEPAVATIAATPCETAAGALPAPIAAMAATLVRRGEVPTGLALLTAIAAPGRSGAAGLAPIATAAHDAAHDAAVTGPALVLPPASATCGTRA